MEILKLLLISHIVYAFLPNFARKCKHEVPMCKTEKTRPIVFQKHGANATVADK